MAASVAVVLLMIVLFSFLNEITGLYRALGDLLSDLERARISEKDSCSIAGIMVNDSIVLSVNVSNTGSSRWWDLRGSHLVVEILLTNGSKIVAAEPASNLSPVILNDTLNPGIVDPGEVLELSWSTPLNSSSIYSITAVFSTRGGSICEARG